MIYYDDFRAFAKASLPRLFRRHAATAPAACPVQRPAAAGAGGKADRADRQRTACGG